MKVIAYHEGRDGLGTEYADVAFTTDDGMLYAQHSSFRRGGCLYAGTVVVRNFKTGTSREIDVTSRATDSAEHGAYLLGLAAKHLGGRS